MKNKTKEVYRRRLLNNRISALKKTKKIKEKRNQEINLNIGP